jgi:hypothetical protein
MCGSTPRLVEPGALVEMRVKALSEDGPVTGKRYICWPITQPAANWCWIA